MIVEKWRAVGGYEGRYDVSSFGRVRSLRQVNGQIDRLRPNPIMLRAALHDGYPAVTLCSNNVKYSVKVHILVITAFRGQRPSAIHQCAHEDGNRANAMLTNLRWKTPRENEHDKVRHGRNLVGSRVGTAKLTEDDVARIRMIGRTKELLVIARMFGVSISTISLILLNKTWRHVEIEEAK